MRRRCDAATPGPWEASIEGRDHASAESFILRGRKGFREEDLYLTGATIADYDFIAHARQDIPLLLEEINRLRNKSE